MSKKKILKAIFSNIISCFTADNEQKNEKFKEEQDNIVKNKQENELINSEYANAKVIYARVDKQPDNQQAKTKITRNNLDESTGEEQVHITITRKNVNKSVNKLEDTTEYNYEISNIETSIKGFSVTPTPNNSATVNCVKNDDQQEVKKQLNEQDIVSISKVIEILKELKNAQQSNTEQASEKHVQFLSDSTTSIDERSLEGQSNNLYIFNEEI